MDNTQLLSYALKRRNFFVAMWLTLQQRWFVRSFNSAARVMSWFVIALGMTLVTFTVVTLARNVVPVLTTPNTVPYYLLQFLVLLVSFNIYVNYLCATAFSRRVGKAPATYTYRDPYRADGNAVPSDDSEMSETEDEEDEDPGGGQGSKELQGTASPPQLETTGAMSVSGAVNASVALSSRSVSVPQKHDSTISGSGKGGPAKRLGGIQVVRVFGEGEEETSTATHMGSLPVAVRVPPHALFSASSSQQPPSFASSRPLLSGDGAGATAHDGEADTGHDGSRSNSSSTSPLRFLRTNLLWRRMCALCGSRRQVPSSHSRCCCRGGSSHACGRLPCAGATTCSANSEASPPVLQELERLATTAEKYAPRQRAYRVLDQPRRYCSHCRRLKAPREHHCAICNECVAKMDHHCPWINNCVDLENQRYFILFVFWLWVGTFLSSAFVGYGMARQRAYTQAQQRLYRAWHRAVDKTSAEQALHDLVMPYGPAGVLLTSYPTVMVLCVTVTMFLAMTVFLYVNKRLVLENTTVIESIYVEEKRRHVYRSTGFAYRSPYDLGPWWNVLDMLSPAGDPVVAWELNASEEQASSPGAAAAASSRPSSLLCTSKSTWFSRVCRRVFVVLWLTTFPTFRPIHGDGVHYVTFDALASGEQSSLLLS